MATSVRGQSGSRSSSTSGHSTWYGGGSSQAGWGSTGGSGGRGTARKVKRSGGSRTGSAGYKTCENSFAGKVESFKMLWSQAKGPGRYTRPSPTTLNTFANWINKGGVVQTVSSTQVSRWAKATKKNFSSRTATTTACKNVLCAKFGKSTIKAVARTKTGAFMVATPSVVRGKRFCFPK